MNRCKYLGSKASAQNSRFLPKGIPAVAVMIDAVESCLVIGMALLVVNGRSLV